MLSPPQAFNPSTRNWEVPKVVVVPAEQLALSEAELNEEVTKVLRAADPTAPDNVVRYSHRNQSFKLEPCVEHLRLHFALEGTLLHRNSDEAKRQRDKQAEEQDALEQEVQRQRDEGNAEVTEDEARGLRNQFNFSERASQTLNNALRDRGTMTEPPPSVEYSSQCTQWEMYDAYIEDIERKKEMEGKKGKKGAETAKKTKKVEQSGSDDIVHSAAMAHASKIL